MPRYEWTGDPNILGPLDPGVQVSRGPTILRQRYQIFGRGVFIRELHPLLPGEELALWAKLNSAKFLCQYKA